jgi:hypothetical protein
MAKDNQAKKAASAEEAKKQMQQAKDITHVVGEKQEPKKEKPDSEKVLVMKVTVDHDKVEYKAGKKVPKELAELFVEKGFAELV